jgi:hypothetical protein
MGFNSGLKGLISLLTRFKFVDVLNTRFVFVRIPHHRVDAVCRLPSSLLLEIPCVLTVCGPGNSVGIATGYGLDGPGIESRWGRDFLHLSIPALGPIQASCTMGTMSFPVVNSGRGVTLTPHRLLRLLVMKE